ncbi:MAG: hypothetical protein J0I84_01075 [Terrimonas sp.]|nr:hypothetical protein [Terrimonas sp.]
MRKSTFLRYMVFAAAMVAASGYTPANYTTQDCGFVYFVAWKGCPKWPSSQYSGDARFFISNVFSECELVKSAYGGYYLSSEQKKKIKTSLLEHNKLEEDTYLLMLSPVVSGSGAAERTGSDSFVSKEDAIKERNKLINYIKNSPDVGGVLAPAINAYTINTTDIENLYY